MAHGAGNPFTPPGRGVALVATVILAMVLLVACTDDDGRAGGGAESGGGQAAGPGVGIDALPRLAVSLRPGPFQLTLDPTPGADGPDPGTALWAVDVDGEPVGSGTVADNGSAILRELPPGEVRVVSLDGSGDPVAVSESFTVPGDGPPEAAIYGDHRYGDTDLSEGFGYLPTRDGTLLSVFVSLPGPVDAGPYPTLVEYSGYGPSRPDAGDPARAIVATLGYALVQVNVRGTGCSGGSFDAFEPVQGVDGYDVIETVAAQDWSASVGMYGISYAGIMQLQVAASRPPSLRAIAPLSVIDDIGSVLFPGGIYNDGFGESWTRRVGEGAEAYGQGWERAQVDLGDEICARNQELRSHNPDLVERVRSAPYTTDLSIDRSPITYASAIDVPVFVAGAWQDEQTGGRWPALIDELSGLPTLRVTLYNGLHGDAVAPEILSALVEFYDLHLDDPSPGADVVSTIAIGAGLASVYGEIIPIDFNRFDPADAARLRADYAAADRIRVLFEVGAGRPNLPVSSFSATFADWPPGPAEPTYFSIVGADDLQLVPDDGPDTTRPGAATGESEEATAFVTDPAEGAATTAPDLDRLYSDDPGWVWPAAAEENRLVATSGPLEEDLVVVGPASADLWVSARGPDADIEVTISEVGPDGSETYVQNGWLRLSRRALAPTASELRPVITGLERDAEPLTPDGEPVLARVEILPVAHVFRAGSQLRLTVDTPGASRPEWRFAVSTTPVEVRLHTGSETRSRLTLPVLPDFEVPTDRPACGTLRGQPCRPGTS